MYLSCARRRFKTRALTWIVRDERRRIMDGHFGRLFTIFVADTKLYIQIVQYIFARFVVNETDESSTPRRICRTLFKYTANGTTRTWSHIHTRTRTRVLGSFHFEFVALRLRSDLLRDSTREGGNLTYTRGYDRNLFIRLVCTIVFFFCTYGCFGR